MSRNVVELNYLPRPKPVLLENLVRHSVDVVYGSLGGIFLPRCDVQNMSRTALAAGAGVSTNRPVEH
jgi:hypothetical protein